MATDRLTGLVLTRQWQDTGGEQQLVYWLSTDLGPVRVEISGQESVCFVAENHLANVQKLLQGQLNFRHRTLELRCFSDPSNPAVACYFRSQRDLGFARALLQQHAIPVFEADVRPTDRYLMERFVRGTAEIVGESVAERGYLSFEDPVLKSAAHDADLRVVSLDIETSISRQVVISIAVCGPGVEKVLMVGQPFESSVDCLEMVADEKALLTRFLAWFAELDPDVVIGWSVVGFDLKYLQDRCDAHGLAFTLGRGGGAVSWRTLDQGQRLFAVVPGRVVLDGIELLRTATYSFESFSLENVSRELLGRGKLIHDVDSRAFEIEQLHRDDPDALARYNLEDCALVLDIFNHTDLIEFAVQRACMTGLEMDRQGGSVAAFDFLYLPRLHRSGYVAPVVDPETVTHSPGGYVMDSQPGLYRDVVVLDFKSLYPSIIRTFHVDPLALVEGLLADADDQIPGFLGAAFSRDRYILPSIIEELWQARDQAKRAKDAAGSQAIKIIMNSFYGVLGTPGCRFFDPRLASSITMRGHEIIQKTRDLIEDRGYPVIYGDTDSVFVLMDRLENSRQVASAAAALAEELNTWWQHHLNDTFQIESYLEIEFETHFARFLMPTVRGSEKGSKKRYAGLVDSGDRQQLVFKGLETVRSDWSPLARTFQQELYRRVFQDEPVDAYIRQTVSGVTSGQHDDALVLRRRLRRKLEEYVKNVPPHVRAARLEDAERVRQGLKPRNQHGGWINYVMTVSGPEPAAYRQSPIDYNFYIDRQLAPIADAILGFNDSSLAKITDKQLGLF